MKDKKKNKNFLFYFFRIKICNAKGNNQGGQMRLKGKGMKLLDVNLWLGLIAFAASIAQFPFAVCGKLNPYIFGATLTAVAYLLIWLLVDGKRIRDGGMTKRWLTAAVIAWGIAFGAYLARGIFG